MARILPSLREKKRYLVFEVMGNVGCSDAVASLKDAFSSFFGTLESADAGIAPLKSKGNVCVVRVNRKYVDKAKASLALVKRIKNSAVILRSLGVSGSVKGATSKYMNGA